MTDETMNLRSIEDLPTDPEATPETHSAARPAPHPEEPRDFATPSRDGCAFVVGGAVLLTYNICRLRLRNPLAPVFINVSCGARPRAGALIWRDCARSPNRHRRPEREVH